MTRVPVNSAPQEAARPQIEHVVAPGEIIVVHAERPLGVLTEKGYFAQVAIIELDMPWQTLTDDDLAYMRLMEQEWKLTPEDREPTYPSYRLLWFDFPDAETDRNGHFMPFAHTGVAFEQQAAILGEEFLGRDTMGRLITNRGCVGLRPTGLWTAFGPGHNPAQMDYPNDAEDMLFAVKGDPEDPQRFTICNTSSHDFTVKCFAEE